jgi:hypothetical protein
MVSAHPSGAHYLPLPVAVGAGAGTTRLVEGGMTRNALSMDSFAFGLPDGPPLHRTMPRGNVATPAPYRARRRLL